MQEEVLKLKREIERLRSLISIADRLVPKGGSWRRRWEKAKRELGCSDTSSVSQSA